MPFNLLLFPLVGGYYIIANSEWFKYKTQRLESERLIFNSVIAGCILLFVCFVLKWTCISLLPEPMTQIKNMLPINEKYFGVMIFSFIIGILFTEFCNLKIDEVNQIKKAINNIGSDLEKLLLFSADQRELIQVTLRNEKVYIGICGKIPVPDKTTYVNIIPFFSGYRNSETKELILTTDYTVVFNDYISKGKILSVNDLNVNTIIRTDEILTANRFDYDVYDKFGVTPPQK